MAKLLDFGLVKPINEVDSTVITREGVVTGSPLYMAPEQIMKTKSPDSRTDIYAMGGVAYFLLTGRPPFAGSDSVAVMAAQVRDPVVPPSKHQGGIPADLEGIVLRCLEKEPARRFQDAASLAHALGACADAAGWSAEQAEAWWRSHHSLEEIDQHLPTASQPPSDSEFTQAEDPEPTLGASAVEAEFGHSADGPIDSFPSLGGGPARPDGHA